MEVRSTARRRSPRSRPRPTARCSATACPFSCTARPPTPRTGTLRRSALVAHRAPPRHHIHIARGTSHGAEPSFIPAGDHDADSYYEILLTATDSDGVGDSQDGGDPTRRRSPSRSRASPPGVPLSYSGLEHLAPASLTAAIGYRTSISAPDGSSRATASSHPFKGWSDGGARLHPIVVPGGAHDADRDAIRRRRRGGGTPRRRRARWPPVRRRRGSPRLRLDRVRRRARTLRGRVTGLATAPRFRLALRTARSHGRCRHWHARHGRLGSRGTRCSSGVWMRARRSPPPGRRRGAGSCDSTARCGAAATSSRAACGTSAAGI